MRGFAPYLGTSALVLGLLAYGVVCYRVADGITFVAGQGQVFREDGVPGRDHSDAAP